MQKEGLDFVLDFKEMSYPGNNTQILPLLQWCEK